MLDSSSRGPSALNHLSPAGRYEKRMEKRKTHLFGISPLRAGKATSAARRRATVSFGSDVGHVRMFGYDEFLFFRASSFSPAKSGTGHIGPGSQKSRESSQRPSRQILRFRRLGLSPHRHRTRLREALVRQ